MSKLRKLSKFFRAGAKVLRNPALLNLVLDQEDAHRQTMIDEGLHEGFPEIRFQDLLPTEGVEVSPFAFLDGGSLVTDLALIKMLGSRLKAQTYFEIGTWRGESVCQAAAVIPKCTTLNLSVDEMRRRNWDSRYIDLHGFYSRKNPAITHLEGDSRNFDFGAYLAKQDLVFVDGDHHVDSVIQDTETAFKLVSPENGAIIWHDYAHSPESIRWNVLYAIWKGTPPNKRKHLYTVSNTLCAIYFPGGNFTTRKRSYPATPDPGFSVHLKKYQS